MNPRLFHVDAFTDRPFGGNPAAVCLLDDPREPEWMQAVAREMNLSETAFVTPQGADVGLRWFTPMVEVDLCGHATLASAHVLWETGRVPPASPVRFHTRSGALTALRRDGWIELDFPATRVEPTPPPDGYLAALGIDDPVAIAKAGPRLLVQVQSERQVVALTPDFHALRSLPGRGVAVTAGAGGRSCDFVSRYFAPWVGVDEDPVTGSVHCALAVFWASRLGKREMLAYQASKRGGVIRLRLDGDRVHLGGQAVTVARGELLT